MSDEVRAVEALLNEAEARWQVIDVDMLATHTYFARPDITVDDLIANFFEPKFGEGGEHQNLFIWLLNSTQHI